MRYGACVPRLRNDLTCDTLVQAFNEELDSMYNDAQLPDEEAWTALTTDLQQTKQARNDLSKENAYVPRYLTWSSLTPSGPIQTTEAAVVRGRATERRVSQGNSPRLLIVQQMLTVVSRFRWGALLRAHGLIP